MNYSNFFDEPEVKQGSKVNLNKEKNHWIQTPISQNLYISKSKNIINHSIQKRQDSMYSTLLDSYQYQMSEIPKDPTENLLHKNSIILKKMDSYTEHKKKSSLIYSCKQSSTNFRNECPICLEKYSSQSNIIKMPCGHSICLICFQEYIKNKIQNAQVDKFNCPEEKCIFQIPEEKILVFLKKNRGLKKKYEKFKKINLVDCNPDFKWCVKPRCENIVQMIDRKNPFVKCSDGHQFCFKCANDWHPNMKCEDFIDQIFKKYVDKAQVKFCPKCHSPIEKNYGCNHMTCIKCKFNFCWICEREITYGHYDQSNLSGCSGLLFANIRPLENIQREETLSAADLFIVISILIGIFFFIFACIFVIRPAINLCNSLSQFFSNL